MVTAAETASKIGTHMGISFAIMYVATGSFVFGGLAAILEPICTVLLMPFHDKMWERIRARVEERARQTAASQDGRLPLAIRA